MSKADRRLLMGVEGVDMSPHAIDRRMRHLAQLYKLGMSMKEVRWIGSRAEASSADSGPPKDPPGEGLK